MGQLKGLQAMQFVVVIVLAVLVLTLGTGFIQNLFSNIEKIGKKVGDTAIRDLEKNMRNKGLKLSYTLAEVDTYQIGSKENNFVVAINNKETSDTCFKIVVIASVGNPQDNANAWFDFAPNSWISAGEIGSTPVVFDIPSGTTPGNYKFVIEAKLAIITGTGASDACNQEKIASSTFQTYDSDKVIFRVG